ncbi:SbcC/MukB-like Walker B domain-containing protein [Desnuesiella massiliensis]|uniref:SbcC/MukB-like Walker B domain-containing protein n=1 Tax=Desnuesiella massiliensis TaxID=1650662 RepID=UPI0006E45506|nr:AAA family ATPase [Desnuesiella massiliensis]
MKPLKLTMSAFGPYAEEETIDFTQLKDKNIFLITGPTGAGKTTIFDAISYALFDEASGSSRDKDSLRSDFASQDTPTFIKLEFELKGKIYSIIRYPQQERKKSRGEGVLLKNAEAELILPEGSVVTKVTSVNEKINELLGINKNQFRQIVMLPQGEFRRLLEADSSEREIIFRRIFGTQAFESIQRKLEDRKKILYRKISETKTKRDTHVKHLDAGENELLLSLINAENLNINEIKHYSREHIEHDEKQLLELTKKIESFKLAQISLQKSIIEGEEINNRLKERDLALKEYEEHFSKESEYEKKKMFLSKARKALEVELIEASLRDRQSSLSYSKRGYEEALKLLDNMEKALELSKENLKLQEASEPKRKLLSSKIVELKTYEAKVKKYAERKDNIIALEKSLKDKEVYLNNLRKTLEGDKLKLEKINMNFLEAQKSSVEKEKLDKLKVEKELILEELKRLYKHTQEYINNLSKYNSEKKVFEEFDIKYKDAKNHYEIMEDNFRRGQAGLLAQNLKEGCPCPVCGSKEHPKVAELIQGVPTEEVLKAAKIQYEKLKDRRDEMLQSLSDLNGIITKSKSIIEDEKSKLAPILGEAIENLPEIQWLNPIASLGQQLRSELNLILEQHSKLTSMLEKMPFLEESLKELNLGVKHKEEAIKNLESEYTELYGNVKSENELILSIELEIPEEIRCLNNLLHKIEELQQSLEALEKSYNQASDNYNNANKDFVASLTNKEVKLRNCEEAKKAVLHWQQQLSNKIEASGFKDYLEYTSFKLSEEEIMNLEKNISEYYQRLKILEDRKLKAINESEELKPVALEELNEKLKEAKYEEQQLSIKEKNIFSRINNNNKSLKEIEQISSLIEEDEAEYSVIGDLSSITNGDNPERITFERYVLAAYFDEIISAANLRLNKMAGGRFVLTRKSEKGKGRKQEGLELEVFDNYTGKSRHVKTLSGGESFKASLALALGLADVVQAYAGGINLDTMFVDEGFGTLDPESLDNAIETLIDLQNGGRLVGIISHVPELKERIAVRLEISPAKEGSKAKFII